MHLPLDYPTLRVIWWFLLGVLLIAFAVMDGFDLGIGMLLHWVARKEEERRIVVNTVGPVWEGNQVWLVLGAGAIFAAWPEIYAVGFSCFYFAMMTVLFALILRPVGFKYRSKMASPVWRQTWDICLFISGFVPALVFGIAIGNVLQGIPFYYDDFLRSFYTGSFLGLFNPFALLCGCVSVCMLITHGGLFLAIKTENNLQRRAIRVAYVFGIVTLMLFALAGYEITNHIAGFTVTSPIFMDAPSNPLHKTVVSHVGAWLNNYTLYPLTVFVPISVFISTLLNFLFLNLRFYKFAWLMNALAITCIVATVGVSMFPFILPSSSNPNMSLTVWDASSSHLTLFIMLFASAIFLPLIVLYTSWVYYVLRGKVTTKYIKQNQQNVY